MRSKRPRAKSAITLSATAPSCRIACTSGRLPSSICKRSTAWCEDTWLLMWWLSLARSISCWEKSTGKGAEKKTDDQSDYSGDHRVLESFLGAAALWRGHRSGSSADRRLHRARGTQTHGGHASPAGAYARGAAWFVAADRRRGEIAHQRR